MSTLEKMRAMTTIVVDTGDIDAIKTYKPTDATTNPSLILAATKKPQYEHLIEQSVSYAKGKGLSSEETIHLAMDKLFVTFGKEILQIIPGRVSTEVNSRLSYDVQGSVDKAHALIRLYEEEGISRERILIKLASTWEGALAASQLEKEGIHCNMTLLFSLEQAVACAEAKATLISPFVGRILDWYKKSEGVEGFAPSEDPGVQSVSTIYHYYKKFGYSTEIMGASFRNKEEIMELAGCDLLTISPKLLGELSDLQQDVERKLDPEQSKRESIEKISNEEREFRWGLNQNPMATEKLTEGIRNFYRDSCTLEQHLAKTYNLC